MRRDYFEIRTNYLFHHDEEVERSYALNHCSPVQLLPALTVLSSGRPLDSHRVVPYAGRLSNLSSADLAFLERRLLEPTQTLAGELAPPIVAALGLAARRLDPTFDAARVNLVVCAWGQDDGSGFGDLVSYELDSLAFTLSARQEVEPLKLEYPVLEICCLDGKPPSSARASLSALRARTSILSLQYIEEVLYSDHYDALMAKLAGSGSEALSFET